MATGTTPSSLAHISRLKNHRYNEAFILSQALRWGGISLTMSGVEGSLLVTTSVTTRPPRWRPCRYYRRSFWAMGSPIAAFATTARARAARRLPRSTFSFANSDRDHMALASSMAPASAVAVPPNCAARRPKVLAPKACARPMTRPRPMPAPCSSAVAARKPRP
jgi:hypothetical protein